MFCDVNWIFLWGLLPGLEVRWDFLSKTLCTLYLKKMYLTVLQVSLVFIYLLFMQYMKLIRKNRIFNILIQSTAGASSYLKYGFSKLQVSNVCNIFHRVTSARPSSIFPPDTVALIVPLLIFLLSPRCQSLPQRWIYVRQPQVLGHRLPVRQRRWLRRRQWRAQVWLPTHLWSQSPPLQQLRVRPPHVELWRRPWLLGRFRRGPGAVRRRRAHLPPEPKSKLHCRRVPLWQRGMCATDLEVWRRSGLQGQVWWSWLS